MVEKDSKQSTYIIPAPLVHKLIGAVLGAIGLIGAYMIGWAINDARIKAQNKASIEAQAKKMDSINDMVLRHLDGHPARVEDQISDIRRRVERLEDN